MGILRADRVSGLGGANAIKGSVSFNNNNGDYINGYLIVNLDSSNRDNFNFDGDFTIECWVLKKKPTISGDWDGLLWISSDWRFKWQQSDKIMYYDNGTDAQFMNYNTTDGFLDNNWHHLAIVRSSNTITGYVDGTSYGTASESGDFDPGSATELRIGYNVEAFGGNISNLRIVKGTALYTSNFTPPTSELTEIDGTVLLCCQSPGDVTQEVTGNYVVQSVVSPSATVNSKPPSASHLAPDVGEDYGTTFADNTKFDILSYMVPPGGTTAESNRGRGILFGGEATPQVNTIQYVQIQSTGNAIDFGDLTQVSSAVGAVASSTRALSAGGWVAANTNVISYVTIATSSNATDFGDLAEAKHWIQGGGSQTRGIFAGGNANSPIGHTNTVEYVTIATAGNASNFGDIARKPSTSSGSAMNSSTRAVFGGGTNPSGTALNTLEYVTIATTGDATDFGDMTDNKIRYGGCSSSTRGIIAAGGTPSVTNSITYITIATTGNTSDFGDVTTARQNVAAVTNSIRGLVVGGSTPSDVNTIDYITIASLGNASDFGDGIITGDHTSGCSDSHGGLS